MATEGIIVMFASQTDRNRSNAVRTREAVSIPDALNIAGKGTPLPHALQ
ncbi:hypothetical protein [Pseudoduganella albidiflava]|nr:hypothetical protein [Pseudoduganella albidiflava]